jgi:hypothetical protein
MTLESVLSEVKQVQGVAVSSEAGEALEFAGTLDADTLCAVASVSATQLREIGDLLSAGKLERWYVVTELHAYYVNERPFERRRLVAIGEAVKSPEAIAKALRQAAR